MIGGMTMPAQQMQGNASFLPPPVNMMPGAPLATTMAAPFAQPAPAGMWQPGQSLVPNMGQPFGQPQSITAPQAFAQPMPQNLSYAAPQAFAQPMPQAQVSAQPFQQMQPQVVGAPFVETSFSQAPVQQFAPQQFAPQQFAPQQFAQQMLAPQVQQFPGIQYAAPAAIETVQAFPSNASYIAPPVYTQPQVEQIRMPTAAMTYAAPQQPMSYMPQNASYIPAPIVETVVQPQMQMQMQPQILQPQIMQPQIMQPQIQMQPQVASYIPAPQTQIVETIVQPQIMQPQIQMQPQVSSYIPAPQTQFVETIAQPQIIQNQIMQPQIMQPQIQMQPQVSSYIPAPQTQIVETIVQPQIIQNQIMQPQIIQNQIMQPQVASYIPQPQITYAAPQANVVETFAPQMIETVQAGAQLMPGGQSVIVEQVGDWLVCEDDMGIFYHHSLTQQSSDNPPAEFLALFPQGYNAPQLGAFAAAGYQAAAIPQVASYIPAQPTIIQGQPMQQFEQFQYGQQVQYAQPVQQFEQVTYATGPTMMQPQMVETFAQPGQQLVEYPAVMAKVLN